MKTVLAIVTLSSLLSACAGVAPRIVPATAAVQSTVADAAPVNAVAISDDEATAKASMAGLPAVALTDELMFKLLVAEVAFQRGLWQPAYINMLAAAQQTADPRLARRAAEMAASSRHPDEALAAVRLWRKLAPTSDEATQFYLGMILAGDDLSEVKEVFEQRLRDVRPQSRGMLLLQIQRLLMRAKDKKAAFTLLEQISQPYLDLPEAHIALAQSALASGDATRARSEATLGLQRKPESEIAVLTLAQVLTDKAAASKALQTFLKTYPNSRDVRLAYGRMLIEQNQYDLARKEFEFLLKAQPNDLTSLFALGILGTQTNNLADAEKYLSAYLKALAAHPDETRDPAQALLVLAQIAEDRKDTDAALKYLAQIQPGDSYLNAQIRRAQLIARRGDLASARKLLDEQTGEGEPEQSLLIQAQAQILREAEQPQQAFEVLSEGIQRFPNNTDLLYDYAMSAEKANQIDRMETALRKVIKLAPTNQHAYNALGYSFAERNIRLPEAEKLLAEAVKLAPEDPFIMDSMGWVQFRLGKLNEAETLLRRAYQLKPDAEIAVHLGEVLWVRGQKEDAQKFWRDARTKDPKNDALKSTLTRLQVRL